MMTESRKQFEEWARESLKCNLSHNGDHYDYADAYYAWKGWQASRAAVVVKLPDWDCYDTPRQAIEACEDRLKDAGVSYE